MLDAAGMQAFLVGYFAAAAVAAGWVARDADGPRGRARLAWAVIVLLLGPPGLILYLAARQPDAPWKQAAESTVLQVAAGAIGIAATATIAPPFSLSPWVEGAVAYVAALVTGWILFPPRAPLPALATLTAMIVGAFPMLHWLDEPGPGTLAFWGALAAAVAVGLVFAHPWNWLLAPAARRSSAPAGSAPAWASTLTPREREVTALAAGGHSNAEIAAQLRISVRTVESHLYHAMFKLGVDHRADLPHVRSLANPSTRY